MNYELRTLRGLARMADLCLGRRKQTYSNEGRVSKKLKLLFIPIFLCCFYLTGFSQEWEALGPDDFNAPSLSSATYTATVVDANGNIYVAYRDGGNSNKATVRKFDGINWQAVGMAGFSADRADYTSIAIDGNNVLYVVYQDWGNTNKVTVKKFDGTNWQTVGTAGFSAASASYTSIAIDGNNVPYVVYHDDGNSSKATVKKFDGINWQTVGTAGFSAARADYTSIAVDGNNVPYVVYYDGGNSGKATVKKFDGTSWQTVGTAGFSAYTAYYTSIAIDGSNVPYVVYQDWDNSDKATVKKFDGTSWQTVGMAGFSAARADYTSIAIDGNNVPYVVYHDDGYNSEATVKKFDGTSWQTVGTAGFSAARADYTAIAIDGNNVPYVVYRDGDNSSKATVKQFDGSDWVTLGNRYGIANDGGRNISIAIDNNNVPYLSYSYHWPGNTGFNSFSESKVKKFDGTEWVEIGSFFPAIQVELVTDSNNDLYAIYKDESKYSSNYSNGKASARKYTGSGTNWTQIGTNGFTSNSMYDHDVTIDNNDVMYLAYNHSKASVVKSTGGNWYLLGNSDFSAGSARYISIATDNNNVPYVAYHDDGNNSKATVMKYDGTNWVVVGTAGFSAGQADYTSIAIDSNNVPYIVYQDDADSSKATVKKFDGTNWVNVGNAGFSPSTATYTTIIIDNNNVPYVAYEDGGNDDKLTVVKFDGTDWVSVGSGSVSAEEVRENAMTLDTNGNVTIAYHNDYQISYVKSFTGSPTSQFGQSNTLTLDGYDQSDDYVSTTNPNFYADNFTIEGWFKTTESEGTIVSVYDQNNNYGAAITVQIATNGTLRGIMRNAPAGAGGIEVFSTSVVNDGNWHHCALVRKNDDKIHIYIDGALEASSTNTQTDFGSSNTYTLEVGRNIPSIISTAADRHFIGELDEIRLWDVARTDSEILVNYNVELANPTTESNLVTYYNFNNINGHTVPDESSNSNTGTIEPLPIVSVDFAAPTICPDATEWLVPITIGTVPADIGAITLTVDYDNTKMTYDTYTAHANLDTANIPVIISDNNGKITISWISTSGATISNETLMSLKFVPAGGASDFSAIAGQTTDFTWNQSAANNCEIADNLTNVLNGVFNDQTGASINSAPVAELSASDTTICIGDNVTFTATGGVTYEFSLTRGGATTVAQASSASATYATNTLQAADSVTVTVTDANGCSAMAGLMMIVSPLPIAELSASDTTICAGDNVTFTATPIAGSTTYEFFIDGNSQGTASATNTFSTDAITNAQVVTVTVTNENGCVSTSAGLPMVVNPSPTVTLSSDDADNIICAGDSITFTGSGTGVISYTFNVNGGTSVAGTGTNNDEYTVNTLNDGDMVIVTGTNANGCSSTDTIQITVSPAPTAVLTANDTTTCVGDTITFTATGAGAVSIGGGSGNALNFVNSDRVTGTNASLPTGAQARTIEAWIKTDPNSSGGESIFEWGTKAYNERSGLFIKSHGSLVHVSQGSDLDGSTPIRTGAWVHVAATYDGDTTKLYINGNLDASKVQTLNTVGTGFSMGSAVNNIEYFDGTIDEVRVWNVARTEAEIKSTKNTSLSGSESGLVAYFDFNQGVAGGANTQISTLTDRTGNGDGTLSGFTLSGPTSNLVTGTDSVTSGVGGTYEFFVNNVSQGTASSTATFSSSSLANGDKVKVRVTNANGCVAESDEITVTVNTLPTTTLASDDSDARICQGQAVAFTASSSDGADEFIFVSSIDGNVQTQSSTATYTDNGLQDGEIISVIGVNSSTGCQQVSDTTILFDVDNCSDVSGKLLYKNAAETPMGNVGILVKGSGIAEEGKIIVTDTTDGGFTIPDLFDNETYTFEYTTTKSHGGINSTDALASLLDVVGIANLAGLNARAADVNLDTVTTSADALNIQLRFVYSSIDTFPGNKDWVFGVDSLIMTGNLTNQKWYALAMGDVNGSYTPVIIENGTPTVSMINDGQLVVNNGDRIQIPVRIKQIEDIGAITLVMYFPSNAMTIHDVTFADGTQLLNNVDGDQLRVAWADITSRIFATDDVLYYIDATIHDVAAYNLSPFGFGNESELADGLGTVLQQVTLGVPTMNNFATNTNSIEAAVASVRNFPNPFSDKMTIEYDLPSTSDVSIQVFNALGQEIAQLVNETQQEGKHQAIWNANDKAAGVYFYTITITEGSHSYKETRQIVLVK